MEDKIVPIIRDEMSMKATSHLIRHDGEIRCPVCNKNVPYTGVDKIRIICLNCNTEIQFYLSMINHDKLSIYVRFERDDLIRDILELLK